MYLKLGFNEKKGKGDVSIVCVLIGNINLWKSTWSHLGAYFIG